LTTIYIKKSQKELERLEQRNKKWFEISHKILIPLKYSPIKEEELFNDNPEIKQKLIEHNAKRRKVWISCL